MDRARWDDDDQLLAELGNALRPVRQVPERFVQAGKAAFAWHDIDAELAQLSFDSAASELGAPAPAGMRSDRAGHRRLTFLAGDVTIDLEVHLDAVLGQLVPPQPGTVQLRTSGDPGASIPIDEVGWFVIRPVPAGSVRLHVRTDAGAAVITDWITL